MDVELIFKIAAVGIVVAVVNMILSKLGRDEYSTLTTLAGIIIVLLVLLGEIGDLFSTIHTVFELR
ncbi:MAG: stage III sporulation protein AC [Clostridiales bacterium]|nr:MAG: stage III sporulation protein AC [Clostridiales bacterium]